VSTLANALAVPVCAEGTESEPVYEAVVALGCAIGQGWYFGKPMPAEDAREMLVRQRDARGPVQAISARN
jgi:EAL domain-containing protein (putative c-di-GMP-specific phosphodiesterase class I)